MARTTTSVGAEVLAGALEVIDNGGFPKVSQLKEELVSC